MYEYLLKETEAMARYALARGVKVPADVVSQLQTILVKDKPEGDDVKLLADIHNQLSALVAPAKPQTIVILTCEKRKSRFLSMLGPVPLIRQLVVASVTSLFMLLSISLFSEVNVETLNKGLFSNSGVDLLVSLLFLLSAASLGSSFSALYKANDYIAEGTYDPIYVSTYWARYILGVVAGIIMAELIPVTLFDTESSFLVSSGFVKPLFAILGGFSATAVYRILNTLVETMELIFKNKSRQALKEQKQVADLKLKESSSLERLRFSNKLVVLKQQLEKDGNTSLSDHIDKLVNEYVGEGNV